MMHSGELSVAELAKRACTTADVVLSFARIVRDEILVWRAVARDAAIRPD
jgi:hypothetical protein